MKNLFPSMVFVIEMCPVFSQNTFRKFEIEPFIRWDTYPKITNNINSVATYKLAIKGRSGGVNITYQVPIKKEVSFVTGLGYYRYSFTQIISTHQSFSEGDRRVIDYPTQLDVVLGTDSYWYHTVSIKFGLEKNIGLSKGFVLAGGVSIKNYFTFSQRYRLPFDNSFIPEQELQIKNNYKTNTSRYFGLGSELNLASLRKTGKINIGPSLIITVFNFWKQDVIFPTENNSGKRNKWFGGFGTGIKLIYSLQNNHHHAN